MRENTRKNQGNFHSEFVFEQSCYYGSKLFAVLFQSTTKLSAFPTHTCVYIICICVLLRKEKERREEERKGRESVCICVCVCV